MGRPGLMSRYRSGNRPVSVEVQVCVRSAIRIDEVARARGCTRDEVIAEAITRWIVREEASLSRARRLQVDRVLREAEEWAPLDELLAADWSPVSWVAP